MNIQKFLPVAIAMSKLSKDRSTQVGAIVIGPDNEVRSTGWNGFPRGVDDNIESRHQRPMKYKYTSHAEENAIAQAARIGVALKGCTIMVTSLFPCTTCSRLIIQSGITKVLAPSVTENARWDEEAVIAMEMLLEAKVVIEYYDLITESDSRVYEGLIQETING
jgi:dCMP deaminase